MENSNPTRERNSSALEAANNRALRRRKVSELSTDEDNNRPSSRPVSASPPPRLPHQQTQAGFFSGTLFFGALLYIFWSFTWAIAPLFVAMSFVILPIRIKKYVKLKWSFFLIDYCYWVNAFALYVLLFAPRDERLMAAAFSMAEGPVGGALIVWKCSWAFGSLEHTISVLIHVMPGLALYSARWFPCSQVGWSGYLNLARQLIATFPWTPARFYPLLSALGPTEHHRDAPPGDPLWLIGAPLAFYCIWQLTYYLIVQVVFLPLFLRDTAFETSYKWLTRKYKGKDTPFARFVTGGSTTARIVKFGLLQLTYTVVVTLVVFPCYDRHALSSTLQAAKVLVALWHGSRYTTETVPRRMLRDHMSQLDLTSLAMGAGELVFTKPALPPTGAREGNETQTRSRSRHLVDSGTQTDLTMARIDELLLASPVSPREGLKTRGRTSARR